MLPRVGFSGLRAGLWTLRPQTTIIRTRAKNIHSLPQLLWGVSVCASLLIPMRGQESDPRCSSCFLPAFVPTHQAAALVMGRPSSEVPQYNDTAGKHSTKRRKCRANPYSTGPLRPLSTEGASWELRLDLSCGPSCSDVTRLCFETVHRLIWLLVYFVCVFAPSWK